MKNNYKQGDKAVVEVSGIANTPYGKHAAFMCNNSHYLPDDGILGKLEDFQPKEDKIKFTPEEKVEFDGLRRSFISLHLALSDIKAEYLYLNKRLFGNSSSEENNKAQIEFTKAWEKPSRIVVIKPEHRFEVGDLVKVKVDNKQAVVIGFLKNTSFSIHVLFSDGIDALRKESQLEFIKRNAISWEDKQNGAVIL
ncbi:hypothetical protein [Liquorilactobacillus hordei]|uniref:hypothetical protein n=1 Tax=Liquorilactobacillus hordei TaxID=468911 RepID=UPI0039E8DC6C